MTWLTWKTLVQERLKFDGEAYVDLSDITAAGNTTLNTRAKMYFDEFCKASYCLYNRRIFLDLDPANTAVNLVTVDDHYINAFWPGVSTRMPFDVKTLFLNGERVTRVSASDIEDTLSSPTIEDGPPTKWAMVQPGVIALDKTLTSTVAAAGTDNYCTGWHCWPGTTSNAMADTDVVVLRDEVMDVAASFACARFMEATVSEIVSMERMDKYSQAAGRGVAAIKAEALALFKSRGD